MKRISFIFFLSLFALLTSAAVLSQVQSNGARGAEVKVPDVVLHVKGMACSMCARSMTKQLEKIEAVDKVEVILEGDQKVLLLLDEGATVSEEELREAVTKAGFTFIRAEFEHTPH